MNISRRAKWVQFKSVSCGNSSILAISKKGDLYCWGNISQFRCGIKSQKENYIFTLPTNISKEILNKVETFHPKKSETEIETKQIFTLISAGQLHGFACIQDDKESKIIGFGTNSFCKLGNGITEKEICEP